MFPGLILVPSILDLREGLSTTLSSRLGTALHLSAINKELGFNDGLNENLKVSLINSIALSIILGIITCCEFPIKCGRNWIIYICLY